MSEYEVRRGVTGRASGGEKDDAAGNGGEDRCLPVGRGCTTAQQGTHKEISRSRQGRGRVLKADT